MRVICSVVKHALLTCDGKYISEIDEGMLVYCGYASYDNEEVAERMARRLAALRIMKDRQGRMNCNLNDTGGEMLFVPNFTLYADNTHGNRPSFYEAMQPERAEKLYEFTLKCLREQGIRARAGVFGGHMEIEALHDGPVNIIITLEPR